MDCIGAGLPQTDAFEISGHLAGSRQSLTLASISGNVSAGGAQLAVSGRVGNLTALSDLNLQLKGLGKDLAQAGAVLWQKLPPTDEFAVQGRLTVSAKALSLQDVQGQAHRGILSLDVTGAVRNVLALDGMDLKLKTSGKELAEIGPLLGKALPELGTSDLSGHLKGSARAFSLDDLTAVVDRSDFHGHAFRVNERRVGRQRARGRSDWTTGPLCQPGRP